MASHTFPYEIVSGVADFGGYHNGNVLNSGLDFTLSTYLFGPRISYRHWNRVTPFGEVLFGVERVSTSTATANRSDNGFAMTAGGGFDVKLANHFSVRPVKVDYLLTRFDSPDTRYTQDTAHKIVEEANLFIDAAHKCHAKYQASLNVLKPTPAVTA